MANDVHSELRPIPDPTFLTTQQLLRELASLKDVVFTRLDGMDRAIVLFNENITRVPTDTDKQIQHLRELHESKFEAVGLGLDGVRASLDTRLADRDKAIQLLQAIADSMPERVDEKIGSLKENHEEKFSSIQVQFRERDVRTEQSSKDSKVAVDAALQAAKEAVGEQNKSSSSAIAKSEAATAKQIDQIMQLIQSGNKATDDKIGDIKDRITRLEGRGEGKAVAETDRHSSSSLIIAVCAVILSLIGTIAAVTLAIRK